MYAKLGISARVSPTRRPSKEARRRATAGRATGILGGRDVAEGTFERLRRLYGEWAKGNLWALRDIADPEIEWEWAEGLASIDGGPRIYHGLDEIAAGHARVAGGFGTRTG